MAFSKRIFAACWDFTEETAAQEKQNLINEYVLRGHNLAILEQLATNACSRAWFLRGLLPGIVDLSIDPAALGLARKSEVKRQIEYLHTLETLTRKSDVEQAIEYLHTYDVSARKPEVEQAIEYLHTYDVSARKGAKGEATVLGAPAADGRIPQGGEGPTAEWGGAWGRKPQEGHLTTLDLPEAVGRRPESGEFQALDLPAALGRKSEASEETDAMGDLQAYMTRAVKPDVEQPVEYLHTYETLTRKANVVQPITDCGVDKPDASAFLLTPHLHPTDDVTVCDDLPNMNFDANPDRQLALASPPSGNRWSYLRFDVHGYPAITLAKLRLYCWKDYGSGVTHTVRVFEVANDAWLEEIMTWNTKVAVGAQIAVTTRKGAGWAEWDVTSYVEAQRQTDRKASMCVKVDTLWLDFHDKENPPADEHPELYLEY